MRWRRFTSRWCSPSSSTLLQPGGALQLHQIKVGLKQTYDVRFGSTLNLYHAWHWPHCVTTCWGRRWHFVRKHSSRSSTCSAICTTSCQAELNTHINCDLAVTTVLWLLSLTPETSLLDSCSKTCISVHKLIFKTYFYPHIVHCCVLSTFH